MEFLLKTVKLSDHRVLEYTEFGDARGYPIFYIHGAGAGSALFAKSLDSSARERGIRVIAPNRPGIGNSTFKKNRTLLSGSDDLKQLRQHLEILEYSLLSESGGSAFALAEAFNRDQGLRDVHIVSGVSSQYADFSKIRLTLMNKILLWIFKKVPEKTHNSMLQKTRDSLLKDPARFFTQLSKRYRGPDLELIGSTEYQDIFKESVILALRQDLSAPLLDMKLALNEWPFDLGGIDTPVTLWHGEKDQSAPLFMAKYLNTSLENSQLKCFPGEGHISLLSNQCDEILRVISRTV